MGKVIKLTEEELHRVIREKIQEALEHNVDLDYSPAIGNKKRGPGKETMDQMKKRKNTKLDEDVDERDIYRRLPDGDLDYDGDDGIGGSQEGGYMLELSEDAYAYAFEQVNGRVPGNLSDLLEEYSLPEDVEVRFTLDADGSLSDWEINDSRASNANPEMEEIIQKAAEYAIENTDVRDLAGYIDESRTVRLTMTELHNLISESVKTVIKDLNLGK